MSTETDATRLAEIGARCERATEGPWAVGKRFSDSDPNYADPYFMITGPDRISVVDSWMYEDAGVQREEDADFIARARDDVPWLLGLAAQLRGQLTATQKADAAWRASESRLVRICQLLGVDYACEEPETCEQVIDRMKADTRELKGKLDIIVREGAGEPPDSLAADYGGTGWEKSKEVLAVRMERGKAADAREALASDAGKPEADVIAAAERYEDYDHQYSELDPDNPWYGHYKEILLEERMKAKKDLCEAVVRLREGSGGAAEALEKGGGE